MDNDLLKTLNDAEEFLRLNKVEDDLHSRSLLETLENEILSDANDTISLFYKTETREAVLLISGKRDKIYKENMDPEEYLHICKKIHIEENNNYNESVSYMKNGVAVRVFAMTRPVSEFPNITISTAKPPPALWNNQIELVEILGTVTKENFIVVGGSGAGKTYLMNYLLKEEFKSSNKKIGLIEEFIELFAPNDCTSRLIVPPAKPNENRLLQYITEMSNLMRFDFICVGEIKGPEAWPFIINLYSGTKGAATVHGSSAREGLKRLINLCCMSDISERNAMETISKSIKYVIYVEKHEIKEIIMLTGVSVGGVFQSSSIWSKVDGFNQGLKSL